MLTFHNDNARTGVQPHELVLTAGNVDAAGFGKLYSFTVDGYLFAQPLVAGGYTMADGKPHNVLFAATSLGTIYAFDADNKNPASGFLWSKSLIPAGEQAVVPPDYGCPNPAPQSVVVGTPVIDRAGGALYVVSKTKSTGSGTQFIQRIHALNLADGTEKYQGPTVIQASINATAGAIPFDPLKENQRAALVLSGGNVYIAWASHCDIGPYHGWVLGYSAQNLSQQVAVYNDTPNANQGGIWMGAGGIAADPSGNLYVISGNGTFDANTGGADLSDAVIKLAPGGVGGLQVADYFAPFNQALLSGNDFDVGSAEPLLLPATAGAAPTLLLGSDKTGRLYLLDLNNLGKYQAGPGATNGDIQDFALKSFLYSQPAYFNGALYVGPIAQPLLAFTLQAGTAGAKPMFNTQPASVTSFTFSSAGVFGGTSPSISTNAAAGPSGIVWAVDQSGASAVLHAYDAANLATELYNSNQAAGSRDLGVPPVKFQSAVIANGRVFVAGQSSIAVYGLLGK